MNKVFVVMQVSKNHPANGKYEHILGVYGFEKVIFLIDMVGIWQMVRVYGVKRKLSSHQ